MKTLHALLIGSLLAVAATSHAQNPDHVKSLNFRGAQAPAIQIDLREPIRYFENGSVEVTCIPIASDPRRCFADGPDPRAPIVALTSSLPWVPGTGNTVYQASSGTTFTVFRQITNVADVCLPSVEGDATVEGWTTTPAGGGSSTVRITVAIASGQSRDITLALRCFNQWGGPEATRRTFRVFRP